MTDEQIIKALECLLDKMRAYECENVSTGKGLITSTLDLINRLKEENNDLVYKLAGVMHSVDKWLEKDELKQDEVNRAITMREKTLQITEKQEAEIERLRQKIKEIDEHFCEGKIGKGMAIVINLVKEMTEGGVDNAKQID